MRPRIVALLLASALIVAGLPGLRPEEAVSSTSSSSLDFDRITEDIRQLSSIQSRFTGYPGYYDAASFIYERFKALNLNTWTHNFTTIVPLDNGSCVEVDGRVFPAYSLYPNKVAYGLRFTRGGLVDLGHGSLEEMNGKEIDGKVVLIDFDSGDNWLNAVKLGAKAVLFHGGEDSDRFESMQKIVSVALNIPRLYLLEEDALELKRLADQGAEAEVTVGMEWEEIVGVNIVGEIKGQDPQKLLIVVCHYDSASVVPGIAPGAEDSIGVAVMLELARLLSDSKPKYTIWFVAVSGHWQGLAGARAFVEDFYFNDPRVGTELFPYLAVSIDLGSGSPTPNVVIAGYWYRIGTASAANKLTALRFNIKENVLKKLPEDIMDKVYSVELDTTAGLVQDTGRPIAGLVGYTVSMAYRYILDMEPFELAGTVSIGVVTTNDMRPRLLTLSDTFDKLNLEGSILPQVQFIDFMMSYLFSTDIGNIFAGDWKGQAPSRMGGAYEGIGFTTLQIQSVRYDPLNPNQYSPVPESLILLYETDAPFFHMIVRTNSTGWAVVHGLAPTFESMTVGRYAARAYKVDEEGRLIYAPDDGSHGSAGPYPRMIRVMRQPESLRTALFECGSVVAVDLTSPVTVQSMSSPDSLYNPRNAYSTVASTYVGYESPMVFSIVPFKMAGYAPLDNWGQEYDANRGVQITYVPTEIPFGLNMRATGLSIPVGLLVNATLNNLDGYGYVIHEAGDQYLIPNGLIGMYQDLLVLAEGRYASQTAVAVLDPTATQYIDNALLYDGLTSDLLDRNDYSGASTSGLVTWGYAQAAYSASLDVLRDSVTSVIIAFALAIPFVVLFSALIYGLTRGFKSVVITSAIAIAVAVILSVSHPGFTLAANVPAIFMGVMIFALVLPAMFFLFANFSTALSELRREVFGEHFLERSGFEVSFSAVSIGLGNMRKRPLRTLLTMSSIVLVAFALSSLTSVTEMRVVNVLESTTDATYDGILIHTPNFFPLDRGRLLELAEFISGSPDLIERYWVYLPAPVRGEGIPNPIQIRAGDRVAEIYAVAGISHREIQASFADYLTFIVSGSVFESEDEQSCIIPLELATGVLKVGVNDTIYLLGTPLRVVGIYNSSLIRTAVRDSDSLVDILPVNYADIARERTYRMFQFGWSEIILIPAGVARRFPEGSLTSALIPLQGQDVNEALEKVRTFFSAFEGLNFYVTTNGTVRFFSKANAQSTFGLQFLVIPIIMAGLVTMSTVLGGVMERLREAGIYSSLGLAPLQVGIMFLTENVVYAIVGGMLGYLGGMATSSVFHYLGAFEGIVINYTSLSVAIAIGSIILLVLLASLYPMYRVALIVTPSLERRWRIESKPKGDIWDIPIPFRVKDERKAVGITVYLKEYLWNKRVERAGDFTVEDVSVKREDTSLVIRARVWLPPYEENIRQDAVITISKSKTELKYMIDMQMKRVSGAYESWMRFSYPFVDEIRKQLLTWSLLTPEQEQEYVQIGVKELGGEQTE